MLHESEPDGVWRVAVHGEGEDGTITAEVAGNPDHVDLSVDSTEYDGGGMIRLSREDAWAFVTDLIALLWDTEKRPFRAKHGPPYPPPGWILTPSGAIEMDPLYQAMAEWVTNLDRRDTPFLGVLKMIQTSGPPDYNATQSWGMAWVPRDEGDDDAEQ